MLIKNLFTFNLVNSSGFSDIKSFNQFSWIGPSNQFGFDLCILNWFKKLRALQLNWEFTERFSSQTRFINVIMYILSQIFLWMKSSVFSSRHVLKTLTDKFKSQPPKFFIARLSHFPKYSTDSESLVTMTFSPKEIKSH